MARAAGGARHPSLIRGSDGRRAAACPRREPVPANVASGGRVSRLLGDDRASAGIEREGSCLGGRDGVGGHLRARAAGGGGALSVHARLEPPRIRISCACRPGRGTTARGLVRLAVAGASSRPEPRSRDTGTGGTMRRSDASGGSSGMGMFARFPSWLAPISGPCAPICGARIHCRSRRGWWRFCVIGASACESRAGCPAPRPR